MIAYKESDIKFSWSEPDENQFTPPKVCDYIKENGTVDEEEEDDGSGGRHKRSSEFNFNPGEGNLRQTRCPLLLVADYRFYKEMGGSNSKTTVNYLISLIDRVHKIYEDTVWRDTMDSGGFSGMGFIIKKIVVHRKPTTVREGEVHYNMFRSSWDVRNLLEVFSREYTHKDFCLAHLFTDIKVSCHASCHTSCHSCHQVRGRDPGPGLRGFTAAEQRGRDLHPGVLQGKLSCKLS